MRGSLRLSLLCIIIALVILSAKCSQAEARYIIKQRHNKNTLSNVSRRIARKEIRSASHTLLVDEGEVEKSDNNDGRLGSSKEELIKGCAELIASGEAESCEPDQQVYIDVLPNDPLLGTQWAISDALGSTGASIAWESASGAEDVVVAILDTGIDYNHPDLAANIWSNPGEILNNIDDDHNGYVDDIHGINLFANNGDPLDDNGHGTHVAGIIGASGNNGQGVAGLLWKVKLIGIKFLGAEGGGNLFDSIRGLDYLVELKKKYNLKLAVSNNSWGGASYSGALAEAIQRANDAGILFVTSAGNTAQDNDAAPVYPSSYNLPGLISVAASDRAGNLAPFSSYGRYSVDLTAPGVGILSTTRGGGYLHMSGSSMAAPFVSGALALLYTVKPNLSSSELIAGVLNSGTTLASLDGIVRTGAVLNVPKIFETVPGETYSRDIADTNPNNISGAAILKINRKIVKAGKRYRVSVFGGAELYDLKIVAGNYSCLAATLKTSEGSASYNLRIPRVRLKNKLKIQLFNTENTILATTTIKLEHDEKVRYSSEGKIKITTQSSAKWCEHIVKYSYQI